MIITNPNILLKNQFKLIGFPLLEYFNDSELKTSIKIYSPNSNLNSNDVIIIPTKLESNTDITDIYQSSLYFNFDKFPIAIEPEYILPYNQSVIIYVKYYTHTRMEDIFILNRFRETINEQVYNTFNIKNTANLDKIVIQTNRYHFNHSCSVIYNHVTDELVNEIKNQIFGE